MKEVTEITSVKKDRWLITAYLLAGFFIIKLFVRLFAATGEEVTNAILVETISFAVVLALILGARSIHHYLLRRKEKIGQK